MPVMLDAATLPQDAIEVGRIGDAWGLKAWMKIHAFSNDPQAFFSSKRWYLQVPQPRAGVRIHFDAFSNTVLLKISQAKLHSGGVVAMSLDIADRNAAELLKGARIFIPRSAFPTPAKDEFYWVDLIGHRVMNRQGVALGTVNDIQATGPSTVLILGKLMIPFVNAYIDQVDHVSKTISVDWQVDYLD